MPNLDFLVHLPLLRIEEELLPFGPCQLYRMPFKQYDEISLGAFSEQKSLYEATEPVFLSLSVAVPEGNLSPAEEQGRGIVELKLPTNRWSMLDELGLGPVNWMHAEFARPAWTALLLAAPASALVPPSWSQTFVAADQGFALRLAAGVRRAARVQGEADHEYLFLPEAAGERIPAADISRAALIFKQLHEWESVPELRAGLQTLRATGSPLLSSPHRATLAVRGLESLLLPEVEIALQETFARRAAALLADSREDTDRVALRAGELYSLRSETLHGAAVLTGTHLLQEGSAEEMLALAIQNIGKLVSGGQTIKAARRELDKGFRDGRSSVTFQFDKAPIGQAAKDRLARRKPSDVYVVNSSMKAEEDRVCCWSPLLGLRTEGLEKTGGMLLGQAPAPILMPLTPEELFDLEERDIRRDFMAEFRQHGHPMAILMTVPEDGGGGDPEVLTPFLERMRDLGVVALRLAGYDRFHDPELFGSAVFAGSRRLRRPTVLRQTVSEEVRHEAVQRAGPSELPRLAAIWKQIWQYESAGRSTEVEHVLSLFRRSFDREFLHAEGRAIILLSLLEALMGRFRPRNEPVQVEDLVEALLGLTPDVRWFRKAGKIFRNQVAHSRLDTSRVNKALDALSRLVCGLVLALLETWNAVDERDRTRRPSDLLVSHASRLHEKKRALGGVT
ncbi:MAG TPA: hypothetical protein VK525_09975 [Candidatus Saccharimonadales bacterium]|nr:hypothetical protein [Candidatus Saccharimonadales bacterium]